MSSIQALKNSMYEYEMMTTQQLAIRHSYKRGSIYKYIQAMDKYDDVQRMDVPAIGRGYKAYYLTVGAAKQMAESRNEVHLYNPKDWETPPGSVLNILMANQFFCELIRSTQNTPGSGLTEWLGRRSIEHRYSLEPGDGKKNRDKHSRFKGYSVFHHEGRKQFIHVDVLSGNETISVIQDMLAFQTQVLSASWSNNPSKVILLILYLGKHVGKQTLKIWEKLSKTIPNPPTVAVANFEEIATQGIFSPLLKSIDSNEPVSLLEMPSHKSNVPDADDLLGKQVKIRLQFKAISGFQSRQEDVPTQSDVHDQSDASGETFFT